ncbi:hypothetical protein FRB99_004988 [Tulasnella sp. 403]|nr:hypothetical protein FRB99_004988 [Tulasnella sp. 403]
MPSEIIPGLSFASDPALDPKLRSRLPTPGQLILVTDDLSSPAEFLLHSILSAHIKEGGGRVAIVSSRDVIHWKAVSSKSGVNLSQYLQSGSIRIVSPVATLLDVQPGVVSNMSGPLRELYEEMRLQVTKEVSENTIGLIIVDEIAELSWSGVEDRDMLPFIRAIRALALSAGRTLSSDRFTSPSSTGATVIIGNVPYAPGGEFPL